MEEGTILEWVVAAGDQVSGWATSSCGWRPTRSTSTSRPRAAGRFEPVCRGARRCRPGRWSRGCWTPARAVPAGRGRHGRGPRPRRPPPRTAPSRQALPVTQPGAPASWSRPTPGGSALAHGLDVTTLTRYRARRPGAVRGRGGRARGRPGRPGPGGAGTARRCPTRSRPGRSPVPPPPWCAKHAAATGDRPRERCGAAGSAGGSGGPTWTPPRPPRPSRHRSLSTSGRPARRRRRAADRHARRDRPQHDTPACRRWPSSPTATRPRSATCSRSASRLKSEWAGTGLTVPTLNDFVVRAAAAGAGRAPRCSTPRSARTASTCWSRSRRCRRRGPGRAARAGGPGRRPVHAGRRSPSRRARWRAAARSGGADAGAAGGRRPSS